MSKLRELIIKISANSTSYQAEIAKASRTGNEYYKTMSANSRRFERDLRTQKQALNDINKQLATVTSTAKMMSGALAGFFSVSTLITAVDDWGQMSARIKMALTSAEGDVSRYEELQQRFLTVSNRNGKAIETTQELYVGSASAMKELGYSTAHTLDYIESLSSTFTANATSAQQTESAFTALNRAMVTGVLKGNDWHSVLNAMPSVVGDIAKELSRMRGGVKVTENDVKLMATKGGISMQLFANAVINAKEANNALADSMDNTVADGFTKATNAAKSYFGEINASWGITRSMSAGLATLTENFSSFAIAGAAIGGIGLSRYMGNLSLSAYEAGKKMLGAAKDNYVLNSAQAKGLEISLSKIRAEKAFAITTQESLAAQLRAAQTETQRNAIRQQMAKNSATIIALNKAEEASTNQLTEAQKRLNFAARAARGTLALLGGPVGAAMLAGGALFYFSQKSDEARESALSLKDSVVETIAELQKLSKVKVQLSLDEDRENLEKLIEQQAIDARRLENYSDEKLAKLERRSKGVLSFAYENPNDYRRERDQILSDIEDGEKGLQKLREKISNKEQVLKGNIFNSPSETEPKDLPPPKLTGSTDKDKGKTKALNDYQQLRKSIESEHFSSLQKIQASEKENNDKLASLHKKGYISQTEMQRLILLNTENHQQKRLELAEKYDPYATIVRKEKEAARELNELRQSKLLSEQQYYSASLQLHNDYTKQKLTEEANKKALPSYDLAGEIDPVVKLQNQLNEQQALYEAYRSNDLISQERYQELMIAATNRSKEAQLEAAKELYGAQGNWQKMQMNLLETVEQRTSNALTGILTGSKSFSETLQELSASLAQSIIQDLIRIAMQAMITNALTGLFGGFAGGGASGASSAASASGTGAMGMSTGWQSYVPNAKGGMYNTPGLSAYSGQVIDAPTFFPFAKGGVPSLGLMGEAGPEAIMPLTRSKDGSLGVRAQLPKIDMPVNEKPAGGNVFNQDFYISGNGDAALEGALREAARQGAEEGAAKAKADIMRDFQTNGKLRKTLGK
ncbi:phage tail tape measure protein [Providencia rettgeri]|uniref:tape measure protein n=1 Tax=Providencia rettgeri TaxID=587 RepID=UPI0008FB8B1A|nr:tape measure protein [Providencia rettgeri]APC12944.1 Lambda phage tail tape-measure protein (Tape_meas_lam_C) [Providencia rettgeri]TXM51238.1 phage tail tape measure protein [Providencia rettgeri]TXM74324.1 phage tail tape measure protein [Providencia rettgeri]